jgi:hypothetical protein
MRRLPLLAAVLVALFAFAAPATAGADQIVGIDMVHPESMDVPPPSFQTSGKQALTIATRLPEFAAQQRKHPNSRIDVAIYGGLFWQIALIEQPSGRFPVVVEVLPDGRVMDVNTGVAASSFIARAHFEPNFARWWVWLPFALLFLAPFVDLRRLRRLLHLDLAVILGFGVSFAVLNAGGHSNAGVLMIYPPMLYLLGRMLLGGLRPRGVSGRLVPHFPTAVLVVGVVALFGARVALDVDSHKVMDIGFASVAGADRIAHRQPLYVDNDTHGDTYGPVNYIAYIPFEAAFPFKGAYDRLWAAHAAAIFFDLMTIVGLVLLGLRLRAGPEGRRLGFAMAWAFAACPFTLLTMMDNTNDGLVAMLLVIMLLVFNSAPARGLVLGLATAAKFSPAALLLLVARGVTDRDGRRQWLQTAGVFAAIFVFTMAIYFPKTGGLHALWNCTLGYQLGRDPDFSLWAVFFNLGWLQKLLDVAGIGVALVAGLWPGRRTLTQVCALAAAVLIAIQLPGGHWFYYYITWWAPLVIAALFTRYKEPLAAALPQAPSDSSEEDSDSAAGSGAGAASRSAFLAA